MKKLNICYRSIMWLHLLTVSAGCSHNSKNYMMGHASKTSLVSGAAHAQPCELDIALKKVDDLVKKFQEYCDYISNHIANYAINHIIRIDNTFHLKQVQDNKQKHTLMLYNEITSIDDTRAIIKLQNLQSPSSTLSNILYLNYWKEDAAKRLDKLLQHPCMQLEDFTHIARDSTKETIGSIQKMFRSSQADTSQNKNTQEACKAFCREQHNHTNLNEISVQEFSGGVFNYLTQDLLPYWGKVVELFLFHALNTSLAQGKMDLKQAQETHQTACKAIQYIYSEDYMQAYKDYFNSATQNTMKYNLRHSPVETFKELKKYILKPIKRMKHTLNMIINQIEYSDGAKLKEQINDSLKVFYTIAYSFGIPHLITSFGDIIALYNLKIKPGLAQEKLLQEIGNEEIRLLTAKVAIAALIEGKDTNLDHVYETMQALVDRSSDLLKRVHKKK